MFYMSRQLISETNTDLTTEILNIVVKIYCANIDTHDVYINDFNCKLYELRTYYVQL